MWALVESYPCLSFHGVIVVCLLHIISGNTPTLPLNRGLASEPSARGSVEIRPSSVAMVIISALSNRSSVSCFERPNERSNERLASAVERADERNNGPRMCLARAHMGTAVEESNTPVYEATKRPNTLPNTSMIFTGRTFKNRANGGNQFKRPSLAIW